MKWIEAKVVFTPVDDVLAAELISDRFAAVGVTGVAVEDPDDEPAEGWGDGPVFRPEHHAVIGFLPDDGRSRGRCRDLEAHLKALEKDTGIETRVRYRRIDEEDWAQSWKAFFRPEKVGRRLVVKPSWRTYRAAPDEIVLEIDPGMAFGTGTHPTTRQCLQMLETRVAGGERVLDVGTGSGILLIAAAKLGAGGLYGLDIDPLAVDIARRNLILNGIGPDRFTLGTVVLQRLQAPPFDIVVANILSEVIVELAEAVHGALAPGGVFICSGIIEKNRGAVVAELARTGFDPVEERCSETWVAMAARRRP